jgi:hypothetical protein
MRLRKHVYPHLGDKQIGLLGRSPSTVQASIKGLEVELAPRTIRGIVSWVSAGFNAAAEDQIIARNPCASRSVRVSKPELSA